MSMSKSTLSRAFAPNNYIQSLGQHHYKPLQKGYFPHKLLDPGADKNTHCYENLSAGNGHGD